MKCEIIKNKIVITPESPTEYYAIKKFMEENKKSPIKCILELDNMDEDVL